MMLGVSQLRFGVGELLLQRGNLLFNLFEAVFAFAVIGFALLALFPLLFVGGGLFASSPVVGGNIPTLQLVETLHFALCQEVIDITCEGVHLVILELIHFGGQSLQEVTVVGDQDQASFILQKGVLEHVFGGHVEVVGRLVEDE